MRTLTLLVSALLFSTSTFAAEIQVKAGGDLQAAINRAVPGDVITVEPNVRFTVPIQLPKALSGPTLTTPITIQPEIPLPLQRVTPADINLMPTVAAGVNAPVITCDGCANWTIIGLNLEPTTTYIGGEGIVIEKGENIVIDRVLLISQGNDIKRGIRGNGKNITVKRSHISGVWRLGQETQAFGAWEGPGPYTITDNFLQAAGVNILFGGADSSSEANICADILVEGNHIQKDPTWKGQPRAVKNLFELKAAKRVIVRNNLFENNWADAQSGRAILFTPRNQDGKAPWSTVEDVLFENNTIKNVPMGFNIMGHDDLNPLLPGRQTNKIIIRHNTLETKAMAFLVFGEVGHLEIYQNNITIPSDQVLLSFDVGEVWLKDEPKRKGSFAVNTLIFAENPAPGTYIHSPKGVNNIALRGYARAYTTSLSEGIPTSPANIIIK